MKLYLPFMKVTCWHKQIRPEPVHFTCTNHMFPHISKKVLQHLFLLLLANSTPLCSFVLKEPDFSSYEHLKEKKRRNIIPPSYMEIFQDSKV